MSRISGLVKAFLFAAVISIMLASCIGIEATTKMDAKGSGTLSMEYQISNEFAQIGALETTSSLPLPLSRTDIEKSLEKIDGVQLKSYSQNSKANNIIVSFSLAFDSPSHLAYYLDPTGKFVQYSHDNGISHLRLTLGDAIQPLDNQMKDALYEKVKPYNFKFTFETAQAAPEISMQNADFFRTTTSGKKVTLESSMADLLTSVEPPQIDISWH
jgi:hypothetical protein